jgi:UDP-3-O-[3-hydroxymyristoyl] glucosamine N-acyltransferase
MHSYTLHELASLVGGSVSGDATYPIRGVASLYQGKAFDIAYCDNPLQSKALKNTAAGAVLVQESLVAQCPGHSVIVPNPFLAFARIAEQFYPAAPQEAFVHPKACIDTSATLGSNVSIGANTVIAKDVSIGECTTIGANCVLESGVVLGPHCSLANGVILHAGTTINTHVSIDSGTVIGARPFNPVKDKGQWKSGPSLGGVQIGSYCAIGANTVVDRGSVSDTVLYEGVHLDNLIQIAHDVVIGSNTAVAGCAAIGAHSRIGAHCIIGGASTISANVELCDDVVITGMSTVHKSIFKAGLYSSGTMISKHRQWRRNAARFKQLDAFIQRLKKLEQSDKHV